MPQYKKVFDIGTYTGNGGQYRVGIPTLRPPGPTGTQIAGSTRFRAGASAYLSRTPSVAGSNQKSTVSCWAKLPRPTDATYNNFLYAVRMTGSQYWYVGFDGSSRFNVQEVVTSSQYSLLTNRIFKDSGVWTHFVASIDTTQATAANRIKLYVDGVLQTSFNTATYPSQNYAHTYMGTNSYIHAIGWGGNNGIYYGSEYYLSNFYYIDGQQLDPSYFGELNSDGIWVPKAYSGTYGTNGFYLPMNSSSNYATDQSGNGNNWTPSGFNVSVANTNYDLMTDSPTDYLTGSMSTANNAGNYCIWSRSNSYIPSGSPGTPTFTNGNMEASIASSVLGFVDLRGTFVIPQQGKWYFEVYQYNNSAYINEAYVGICDQKKVASGTPPYSAGDYGYLFAISSGNKVMNGTSSAYGSVPGNSTTICVAFDADNNKIWFGTNGTWAASGNPAAGTNEAGSTLSGLNYVPCASVTAGNSEIYRHYMIANFGQRPFSYTVPSGFKALNTYNLTKPSDSNLWFYGDTPDLMWIKNRSTTGLHTITDTVRGVGLNLVTSSTAAETSYPGVTEMNKFGMSIINDATSILNGSTNSHVYWAWKAGSNTSSTSVTNTDGFDTSQVSVNRSAGFSIVTYTGTGTNMSVGHGLGAAPNLIIIKARDASQNWTVYHSSVGTAKYLILNSTAATTSAVDYFTGVTNTLWSMTGAATSMATNGTKYVAYCWTAIPGYSAFGSYTGNGSADGPFIYCGFLPRFIMTKGSSGITDWVIHDVTRETYNPASSSLYPNTTGAEASLEPFDILSNGFKIRGTAGNVNNNGTTYIYAAFASIPFKFSRAR